MPGGGRRDPERAEAARKQRTRFARDIGDEHTLGWAHEPRRPRGRFTMVTLVVLILFAGLGALPLLFNTGDGLLPPDCTTAALSTAPDRVGPAGSFAWQVAGPADGSYVVTIDVPEVTADADGSVQVPGGRILGGPMTLPGCRSAQQVSPAPEMTGTHEVNLFRRTGARWERIAISLLTVS